MIWLQRYKFLLSNTNFYFVKNQCVMYNDTNWHKKWNKLQHYFCQTATRISWRNEKLPLTLQLKSKTNKDETIFENFICCGIFDDYGFDLPSVWKYRKTTRQSNPRPWQATNHCGIPRLQVRNAREFSPFLGKWSGGVLKNRREE